MKPLLGKDLIFRPEFKFWGASVAEYQVNGGKTQWAEWEKSEQRKLKFNK